MNYKIFKDKKLSLLGFGGMRFPKKRNGKIDFEESSKMIDYAYKNGVNYYDTAYMYHNGESEVFFGEILKKYPRNTYYLANKMPSWFCKKEEDVDNLFNEQLDRCKVDYFDFYLLHSVTNKNYPISQRLNVVKKLISYKEKGLIKHLGFSFHGDVALLKQILLDYPNVFEFVQLQINYYDWIDNHAKEFYDIVTAHNLPVIVMEPVRGGMLATLSKKSREVFTNVYPKNSVASWAIRFCADLENVIVVLSGMSNMQQTEDNVKNLSMDKLTVAEHKLINTALNTYKKSRIIPCTGCRYCMDCVKGIDIPYVFTLYNEYRITKNKEEFYQNYSNMKYKFKDCIGCGKCAKDCPQGIEIPKILAKIAKNAKEDKN